MAAAVGLLGAFLVLWSTSAAAGTRASTTGGARNADRLWSVPWVDVGSVQDGVCATAERLFGHSVCGTTSSTTSTTTTVTTSTMTTTDPATTTNTTTRTRTSTTRTTSTSTSSTTTWALWPDQTEESGTGRKFLIKGISYAPVPLKHAGSALPDDDFMSEGSATMWGPTDHGRGRRDLMIMKSLGANAVRLYGNDPALDHAAFLDAAEGVGLDVVAGLSDYPFVQMPGNCIQTGFDCFDQIKEQYNNNLKKGFLVNGNSYHNALKTVIIMNEPDLKFEGGLRGTPGPPEHFCKALISGLDGMIAAEKDMNVTGHAPNFTVAFSFGRCDLCSDNGDHPGVGQMLELRRYMKNPKLLNYTARNDMWLAYQTRFINSFNTANPAIDIRPLFLDEYDRQFPQTPVFLGEYHSPAFADQRADLHHIMEIAANPSTMLSGLSFFEFQKRYDKGGGEMTFGMFGLGNRTLASTTIAAKSYSTYCLEPVEIKVEPSHSDFDPNQCGQQREDVDFVVDGDWATHIDHVPTPADCCARCQEERHRCDVWTWVKEAGLDGIPSQCWLKGGGHPMPTKKFGVVSSYMHGGTAKTKKKAEKPHANLLHEILAEAFGGPGLEHDQLCPVAGNASGAEPPAGWSFRGTLSKRTFGKELKSGLNTDDIR